MTVPFVGGFEITKLWDVHRDAAEQAKAVFFGKPKVCDSFEECSDDVDLVFISDCNYDGADHLKLARPGLEKGVPTFIDKPFSDTVANARKILALGKKHKAPIFSLSILRAEPAVKRFRNRIPEVGAVNHATLSGYGTHPAGLVHTTSAAQHLFGAGIKTVDVLKARVQTLVHLDWGDRADKNGKPLHGLTIHTNVGDRPLTALAMGVYGDKTDIHEMMLGDLIYADGTAEIIRMIKRMVNTGKPPEGLMDEVIESIAVIQAYKKAEKTGKTVRVAEFF
jgi:predicted dehydrogenase